jgi:hypothetical protein
MRGVESPELQAGGRHFIEHRGFDMGVAVVSGFLPAVVIAHHEDDVRRCCQGEERRYDNRDGKDEGFHAMSWEKVCEITSVDQEISHTLLLNELRFKRALAIDRPGIFVPLPMLITN